MWELRLEPSNQILLLQCANVYYCHLTYNFLYPLENEDFNCYFKTRTPWYYIIKILFFRVWQNSSLYSYFGFSPFARSFKSRVSYVFAFEEMCYNHMQSLFWGLLKSE